MPGVTTIARRWLAVLAALTLMATAMGFGAPVAAASNTGTSVPNER